MGKIKRGLLGGFSGKVANIVGGSWKGIAYMRSLPLSVSQPNTAKQLNQRAEITAIVACSKTLLSWVIKPCLDRAAVMMSGYNLFIHKNAALYPAGIFDAANADKFEISEGVMDSTDLVTASLAAGTGILTLTWVDDSDEGFKLATDTIHVALLDQDGNAIPSFSPTVLRSAGTIALQTRADGSMAPYYAYAAFRRFDGLVVGKTSYKTVTVA